jgi:hypothetical protein
LRAGDPVVMREIENVRQDDPEKLRRWFHDDYFDLFVWQSVSGGFLSFQLCYNIEINERALVWNDHGFFHDGVDLRPGETPILVPDGAFEGDTVIPRFERYAAKIPADIFDFVLAKMREHHARPPAGRPPRAKVRRERWQMRRRRKEKWND